MKQKVETLLADLSRRQESYIRRERAFNMRIEELEEEVVSLKVPTAPCKRITRANHLHTYWGHLNADPTGSNVYFLVTYTGCSPSRSKCLLAARSLDDQGSSEQTVDTGGYHSPPLVHALVYLADNVLTARQVHRFFPTRAFTHSATPACLNRDLNPRPSASRVDGLLVRPPPRSTDC